MEQMVTDPKIKRVLIVSDNLYADKADGRRGGVGTETQIISKEVYDKVDQNKFIPLVRERDADGNACLPVYLRTRKYIDFSDNDAFEVAYEQLIRNIWERPKRSMPALGRPPAHLFDDSPVSVASVHKAKRFRDVVSTGKGRPLISFEDFADDFVRDLEALRMEYKPGKQDSWCDSIKDNLGRSIVHRDVLIDVARTLSQSLPNDELINALLRLFERILSLTERPVGKQSFHPYSEDNYKFLCYELFLYTFAILIKSQRYGEARLLLDHQYVTSATYGGAELQRQSYAQFNYPAESLEELCARRGENKRISVMADLVKERANRTDIRFVDLLQTDVILWLATGDAGWYPRTVIYSRETSQLELFLRAVTKDGFRPLGILLGLKSPQDIIEILAGPRVQRFMGSETVWRTGFTLESLNARELARVWGGS
jgi:hypothetical protein